MIRVNASSIFFFFFHVPGQIRFRLMDKVNEGEKKEVEFRLNNPQTASGKYEGEHEGRIRLVSLLIMNAFSTVTETPTRS